MIHFSYILKDFEQWLDDCGKFMKVNTDNHFLQLPPSVGSGYLYARVINEGMSFLVTNMHLNDEMVLERKASDKMDLLLYFIHVNVAGYCRIASDIDKVQYKNDIKRRSIFLSSTNYPLQLTYSKGTRVQLVGIHFKSSLVRKFLKKDIFHYITEYSQSRLKGHDKTSISEEENKLLREIFETHLSEEFGRLVLYNRILLLVEKTLNRLLLNELPASKKQRPIEKDVDRLKEVEKILSKKELKRFPSIKELSQIALMSSSKLKTSFKEVYGMKLYEFYNHHRLSKAKRWIETGETNIKEAAYRIGFSNLSNFSKAFKKEFGMLPSRIRN